MRILSSARAARHDWNLSIRPPPFFPRYSSALNADAELQQRRTHVVAPGPFAYPDGVATLGSDRLMFSERARAALWSLPLRTAYRTAARAHGMARAAVNEKFEEPTLLTRSLPGLPASITPLGDDGRCDGGVLARAPATLPLSRCPSLARA